MDNDGWTIIRVDAVLDNLAVLRDFVAQEAEHAGLEDSVVNTLMLAVDEAATNVIVHGYQRSGQGWIELSIMSTHEQFIIRLRDNAPHFDPTTVPEPDLTLPLEQRPLGGMGVYIMHRAMDEVRYHPLPDGNELILTYYLVR